MSKVAARILGVALLAIVSAGTLAVAPAPAGAVGCWGDYCSGTDPQATGCSADAFTVASYSPPSSSTTLELRWSPTCKTNWARLSGGCDITDLRAVQSTGYTQTRSGANPWSRQIYSPTLAVKASARCGPNVYLETAWV